MFDFLRDFGKSEEEKRQEALTAYLDDALTPAEKERFERLLASDEALQANLEEQRLIQASIRRLPRMRAPRNFTLDPALYGRPIPATADRLYPILRTATAVVAVLFVVLIVLEFLPLGGQADEASQPLAFSTESQIEAEEAPAPAEAPAEEVPAEVPAEEAPAAALIEQAEVVVTLEVEAETVLPAEEPAEEIAEEEAAREQEPAMDAQDIGEGAPAEEAPVAEAPAGESARVDEELAAAPEAETASEEVAEASPQPQPTVGDERSAELVTSTPMVAEAPLASDEVAVSQPTPGRTVIPSAPESDEMADDGVSSAEPSPGVESRLTSIQIAAIILGIGLLALLVATLLVRRRTQRHS